MLENITYTSIVVIYIFIGICLMFYWWNKDYALDYKYAKLNGEVEEGAACLLMLAMLTFWPIKLIHKIIKKFL